MIILVNLSKNFICMSVCDYLWGTYLTIQVHFVKMALMILTEIVSQPLVHRLIISHFFPRKGITE